LFVLFIFLLTVPAFSQNVGIGVTNPQEKLDVNGNINISGTIKANGVGGTAGQVLMKNSSNILTWGDMCDFKNYMQFIIPGTQVWPVPSGVTKIMVELWGGGGGGNVHGGGGGGGYARALYDVTPGQNISYTIGDGGAGALNANASSGGSTSITYGPVTVSAYGGSGAFYSNANYGSVGLGGGGGSNFGSYTYFTISGQSGSPIEVRYHQYNATTFYQTGRSGKGGDAGNTINTGGIGTYYVGNSGTSSIVENHGGGMAMQPGGGGPGSYNFGGNTTAGGAGAWGRVIIWY